MIACLVTSNSKIKIQSSDSKNIKEITKVDLDEILASHSTEWVYNGYFKISIHTFLAEGDVLQEVSVFLVAYFNPHLPRGR